MLLLKKEFTIFMTVIRESFITLVPFLFLSSSLLLSVHVIKYFKIDFFLIDLNTYLNVYINVHKLLVPLLVFSISFHLSRRFNVNTFITVVSSLIVLVSYETLLNNNQYSLTIYTLIIPIFSSYFFRIYGKHFIYTSEYLLIATQINISFKYIFPFFLNYVLLLSFILILNNNIFIYAPDIKNSISNLSVEAFIICQLIWSHILWFFGLHGDNFSTLLFDKETFYNLSINSIEYISTNNITHVNILNTFIIYGGSGAGLSLAIAILIYKNNEQWNRIVKLSFPFLIFNINEILIYGLPIVLNRYLLLPFIAVPLFNLFFIYFFLSFDVLQFVDVQISWTTPIFINAFYLTDGNMLAVGLQFIMVAIGILIYFPFIRMYSERQSFKTQEKNLSKHLNLGYGLKKEEAININKGHLKFVDNNNYINNTINIISNNSLELYYQPKINIKDNSCTKFEALLQIKDVQSVKTSEFIKKFDYAGLGFVIDYWVCQKVQKDISYLKEKYGFCPEISINLSPNTLKDNDTVLKICDLFTDEIIEFELLESTDFHSIEVVANMNLLISKGYTFAIDDFGSGYSSIKTLYNTEATTIKLHESLIHNLGDAKANIILVSLCNLCNQLNYKILLEGLETQEQYDIVKGLNIDFIQGYYFSKAIDKDDLFKFSQNLKL